MRIPPVKAGRGGHAPIYAAVAQLVEQAIYNRPSGGSNPTGSTNGEKRDPGACPGRPDRETAAPALHASPHQRSKSTRVPARGAALSTSPSLRRRKGSPPVSLIRTGCGQRADDPLYRLPISAAGEGRTRTNRGGDRSPPLRLLSYVSPDVGCFLSFLDMCFFSFTTARPIFAHDRNIASF